MALQGLDHVAIAVEELEAALDTYCGRFGWVNEGIEIVSDQQARVARLTKGPFTIELVEPCGPTSTIRKFLDRRGPGLHHLCFAVDHLDTMLIDMKNRGVRLIDEAARDGAGGRRIAFVHPSAAGGVLIELSEPGFDPDSTADPDKPATVAIDARGTPAADRLLTVGAVAELHGVSDDMVKAAITAGRLRSDVVHGPSGTGVAMHVVRRSDALAWRSR